MSSFTIRYSETHDHNNDCEYILFEAEALDVEEEEKDRYRRERTNEHENSKSYIIVLLPCEPNLEQSWIFFC